MTAYIYLDESGNFDFGDSGTKHFVLCAMITSRAEETQSILHRLKCKLLEEGIDKEYFHATEDEQVVRDQVFEAIKADERLEFHYTYAVKKQLPKSLQTSELFYAHISAPILEHCFRLPAVKAADKIVVIFDKVFRNKERAVVESIVKSTLKRAGKDYQLYFHQIRCDFNAQIADYGAWALFVQLERDERRPMRSLAELKGSTLKFSPPETEK